MMKKKIKDLTLKEMRDCCNKMQCSNCPLNFKDSVGCFLGYVRCMQYVRTSYQNQLSKERVNALNKSLEKYYNF